jgi:hypothetical protein
MALSMTSLSSTKKSFPGSSTEPLWIHFVRIRKKGSAAVLTRLRPRSCIGFLLVLKKIVTSKWGSNLKPGR